MMNLPFNIEFSTGNSAWLMLAYSFLAAKVLLDVRGSGRGPMPDRERQERYLRLSMTLSLLGELGVGGLFYLFGYTTTKRLLLEISWGNGLQAVLYLTTVFCFYKAVLLRYMEATLVFAVHTELLAILVFFLEFSVFNLNHVFGMILFVLAMVIVSNVKASSEIAKNILLSED